MYKTKGIDWVTDAFMEIFSSLHKNNKELAIELRKFDSINFTLSYGKLGAGNLILSLYKKIEQYEGNEAEFYVQKAKAYYNIYHGPDFEIQLNNILKELNIALTWAKDSNQRSVERNIIHVKALIQLRITVEKQDPTYEDIISTIDAVLDSIKSKGNQSYVNALLNGEITGNHLLQKLISNIRNNKYKDAKLLTIKSKINEIESYIEDAKKFTKKTMEINKTPG